VQILEWRFCLEFLMGDIPIQEKWIVVQRKDKYCVYKEGPNGKPIGKSRGCHDTEEDARNQQKLLYRVAPEQKEMMDQFIFEQEASENKGYIYLSVFNGYMDWEVERLVTALNIVFGYDESWRWNDPYTYHITLAYSSDVTDEQLLETAKAIAGKNALELKVAGVKVFDTVDNEKAVYLEIEKTDELAELQQAVYDSLIEQDVELSEFSDPEKWTPHVTLAYVPIDSAVPEITSQIYLMGRKVCIGRSDYETLAELPLKWSMPEHQGESGEGPVVEQMAANWKVGVGRDLPISKDTEWNGSAAAKSVFEAAGFDSDKPNVTMARKAFLIYNAAAPKLKGSYKLPIAKIVDGQMVVVPAGIRNAASRLPQVKGVSQAVLDRAERVLKSYKRKAGIGEQVESDLENKIIEQHKVPIRLTFISEMRGNPPRIEIPSDIDLYELREQYKKIFGDEELEFVTLPIGQVDAESRNGRTYPEAPVKELVKQVNELRPEGMWGHLNDEEMATRYDPPAIRWLAATIDKDGIAWGKHLPLTVETRDYYRMARATRAKVATSITAFAEMRDNVVEHLDLNTIDIADPRRVGILATVALPQLTQEMKETGANAISLDSNHDVIIRVRELNSEPTIVNKGKHMLTEEQIKELIDERDALKTKATELEVTLKEFTDRDSNQKTTISELLEEAIVSEVRAQVALEEAHDLIIEMVRASEPQNRHAVKEAVQKVLDKESIKKMLKRTLAREMGPRQPVPSRNYQQQDPISKWLEPETEEVN